MAHTKILLREDVDDLGARGEIVRVRAGYARNYLLPRKLAVEATTSNVRQIEQERAALLKEGSRRARYCRGSGGTTQQAGARVQAQVRRAGRAVRFSDVDGYCRSVERARL